MGLLLVILVVLMHLHTASWPVNVDLKIYAVGTHEILHGRLLYTDIWDLKPPAVWVTYAIYELVFGYGLHLFPIMAISCNLMIVFGIYRAGVVSGLGRWAGLLGALIWTLQCADVNLELHNANTEYFINVFIIWAFVGMLSLVCNKPRLWVSLVVGLCFLCASLYKHSIILGLIPLVGVYIGVQWRAGQLRLAIRDIFIWTVVGLVGWTNIFAYFAIQGRFDDIYFTLITYSQTYGGSVFQNLKAKSNFGFWLDLMSHFRQFIFLLALNTLALVELSRNAKWQLPLMLLGYLAFAYVASFCLVDMFEHYFQYWIPVLCLGAGWGIICLWTQRQKIPRFALALGTAWFVLGIASTQLPSWTGTVEAYNESNFIRQRMAVGREAGNALSRLIKSDDFVFVWGSQIEPVMTIGCRMSSGVLMPYAAVEGKYASRLTSMIRKNLQDHPPSMVILSEDWLNDVPKRKQHVITLWIYANFQKMAMSDQFPGLSFWIPNDSLQDIPAVPDSEDELQQSLEF
ncbi:MAG TPA: hypothetical protein DCM28_10130 [Phycisphaerales bacterium]|nr:hypothetical protein [Phycisphaerales bacterium]|tara:strand:- start:661 stop:2202 length:1542 start_codon:yes stop_codon:yes gene_type:complete